MTVSAFGLLRHSCMALILGSALLPVSLQAQQISVPHAQGTLELQAPPTKAAVFDLASLDNLNAIGVTAVAGIAKADDGPTNLPAHLQKYAGAEYAAVGTLFEANPDALKTLSPDLIIIGGRSRAMLEVAGAIAPTIDMTTTGSDIAANARENTKTLAKIFGAEDKAEARIAQFDTTLAALHAQGEAAGKGLVIFAAGKGYGAQAPGARFGSVYDFVGIPSVMEPVAPSAGGPRPEPGSPEAEAARKKQAEDLTAALAAQPDWLFILDRNAAVGTEPSDLAERLAADPQVTATNAWKNGQVIYLDAQTWYLVGAGIDVLEKSATDITAALAAKS